VARHVFAKLPKWCVSLKPGVLWVRCPHCGRPRREYFGPPNRDAMLAELRFLRRQLEVAFEILASRHSVEARRPPRPHR
jgi:hypothetical protein